MTSFRQIEANRRNAQLSTGPVTEEGKRRSRQNAVRHGLTAETVIDALEDAEDYTAFEMAVTADYDAQSAVERELILRLASQLWRLRRATAIESGLFKIQAKQLLQFRQQRSLHPRPPENYQRDVQECRRGTSCDRIRMILPRTGHHRLRRLSIKRTISRALIFACPTSQPTPSIG